MTSIPHWARAIDPSQIQIDDCDFYHSTQFPDGSEVRGQWDIRQSFSDYIGHIEVEDLYQQRCIETRAKTGADLVCGVVLYGASIDFGREGEKIIHFVASAPMPMAARVLSAFLLGCRDVLTSCARRPATSRGRPNSLNIMGFA